MKYNAPLPPNSNVLKIVEKLTLIMKSTKKSPTLKVVFVGDTAAGKTSIIMRYQHNVFMVNKQMTVGASFVVKDVETNYGEASLQIWDTAGQEKYRSLVPMYSRGATAAMVVFDVNEPDSFSSVPLWVDHLRNDVPPDCIMFIVGNKLDLNPNYDRSEAEKYAHEKNLHLFFVSAKNGEGIDYLFDELALMIPATKFRNTAESEGIQMEPEKKSNCC